MYKINFTLSQGTGQIDNINCITKRSSLSGSGDRDEVSVSCPNNYYMTDCTTFSQTRNLGGTYYYQDFIYVNSVLQCRAVNAPGGSGVYAYVCVFFYLHIFLCCL